MLRGMTFIAISGLLFTLLNTIMRRMTHELDPLQVQFLRYLMGIVVMLPFMLRGGIMAWMPHNL
ncbi:MAG: EamA/RhaT family transporter, partial [Acetobacteraceae bacterium]|nr:EamA/RhaT family transporter [Acetobacteraceae bacterium]